MIANKDQSLLQNQQGQNKKNMQNTDRLCLHTKIAQSLFDSKWEHGRMGLIQFAAHITTIYAAYQADDPYAEWMLIHTYDVLCHAMHGCEQFASQLQSYLKQLHGIELGENSSHWKKPIYFSTFFPYLAATLLGKIDQILQQLMVVERYRIIQTEQVITRKMIVQLVQNVFAAPRKWRLTNVTRHDIVTHNKQAQEASVKLNELIIELGALPDDILNQQRQFVLSPKRHDH